MKDTHRDSVPREMGNEKGVVEDMAREKEGYPHPTGRVQ